MSVYRRNKSRIWHYDFRIKGHRFCGSTGQVTRRAAEAVERKVREDAALGRLTDGAQLTLDQAAQRWWLEYGRHRKDADSLEGRVLTMVKAMGPQLRLAQIDQGAVARGIERRRGMAFRRSTKAGSREFLPANGTVNRAMIETLRPILGRAASHWSAQGLPAIDWGKLRLAEPRELVRTYTAAEQSAWIAEARRSGWWDGKVPTAKAADVSLALELILTYGLRLSELMFPLTAFDPDGPRLAWVKGRKGDVPHTVPLLERHGRAIAALVSQAKAADLPSIWFYRRRRRSDKKEVMVAITIAGLQQRLNTAGRRAGIGGGRLIHGGRHHAGSAIVRNTGNLKLAQRLLGHAEIASTMRYVHAFEDELRGALEAQDARNSPDTDSAAGEPPENSTAAAPLRGPS